MWWREKASAAKEKPPIRWVSMHVSGAPVPRAEATVAPVEPTPHDDQVVGGDDHGVIPAGTGQGVPHADPVEELPVGRVGQWGAGAPVQRGINRGTSEGQRRSDGVALHPKNRIHILFSG